MRKLQLLAAACIAFIGFDAMAQAWPTKTVRIISPFPPGGSVDQVSRLLAAQLSQQTGQQFIVENRSGASGVIGTQAIAQAAGDGYTLGVVFDTHAVNPSLMANMPYDTLKDLKPVMLVGTSPMALVAPASQPYKDFRDVLAEAKKKPIPFGTIGAGSLGHLAMAQVANLEKVQFTHVPYKGGGPLMIDAIGGQIPLAIGTVFLVTPHVKAGKLKALAVTSLQPSPQLPGVAPMADQGVPGFSALAWWGVLAPGTTPPPLVHRIYEEFARALKDPALTEKLRQQGMDVQGAPPEELDRFIREQITRWAKVVQDNGIKPGD
ncbi:MAG TPA: tripartite tricarboxylate transporter substrate binding protein [Usitatibacter sp.]|nr:tripartite tricarboxylate transporter substrate binding protein [Usitatibacter sp.]